MKLYINGPDIGVFYKRKQYRFSGGVMEVPDDVGNAILERYTNLPLSKTAPARPSPPEQKKAPSNGAAKAI